MRVRGKVRGGGVEGRGRGVWGRQGVRQREGEGGGTVCGREGDGRERLWLSW